MHFDISKIKARASIEGIIIMIPCLWLCYYHTWGRIYEQAGFSVKIFCLITAVASLIMPYIAKSVISILGGIWRKILFMLIWMYSAFALTGSYAINRTERQMISRSSFMNWITANYWFYQY